MAATQTLHHSTGPGRFLGHLGHRLQTVVGSIVGFFSLMNRANGAALQYEHLSQLSDASLAARGIARQDIGKVVMDRFQSETR
ncbi:MAG: hypothetical protein AAF414_06565 [Pseudomonadota bacterium]